MAPNPRRVEAKFRELYEEVPSIDCKGGCHNACCFIVCTIHEKERVEKLTGKKFETVDLMEQPKTRIGSDGRPLARFVCSALTEDGRCSVYDDRPLICRLYGVSEGMPCFRGCKPDRALSHDETLDLIQRAEKLGRGNNIQHVSMDVKEAGARDAAVKKDFAALAETARSIRGTNPH